MKTIRQPLPIAAAIGTALLAFSAPANADEWNNEITLRAGTLGPGIEYSRRINDYVSVAASWHGAKYSYQETLDEIDYDLGLKLSTTAASVTLRPFGGATRITAGLINNGNGLTVSAVGQGSYEIGDEIYSASEVGQLSGSVTFDKRAAYAGIGWDLGGERTALTVDIGVMFQNSPTLSLSADGLAAQDPEFMAELAKARSDAQSDLDAFTHYPVIAIGLRRRF